MDRPSVGGIGSGRRALVLAVGDAAMIALFVALGELRHGQPVAAGFPTFVQFGLGWLLVAGPAGVYADEALASPRRAVVRGVAAWVVAAIVGQLIRLLVTTGGQVQPTFVVVSVAVGGAFIGGWRFLAANAVA